MHHDISRSDRADRQLRLAGHADLADQHDIERRVEGTCHLIPHRHSAAGQGEHQHRRQQWPLLHLAGECRSRCGTVGEYAGRHRHGPHTILASVAE